MIHRRPSESYLEFICDHDKGDFSSSLGSLVGVGAVSVATREYRRHNATQPNTSLTHSLIIVTPSALMHTDGYPRILFCNNIHVSPV